MYRKPNPKTPLDVLARKREYSARYRARSGHKSKVKRYNKAYRKKHKHRLTRKARHYQRSNALRISLRRKGLLPEDYQKVLANQGMRCAICPHPPDGRWKKYVIDHDHTTGVMRGLLCNACNKGIGLFADNPQFLKNAAKYLQRPMKVKTPK